MKKFSILFLFLSFVGGIAFLAYEDYRTRASGNGSGNPMGFGGTGRGGWGPGTMQAPLVEAAVARTGKLEEKVQLVGSLKPIAEVQIMSKIAGRIERVLVDVGDAVSTGQLLAQVEEREIQQQIRQAEASLAVSRASIQQREAEFANLTRQVRRYRELYEQDLISKQDLEDLITSEQSAQAQRELARAQARQAEANLNQYKINLENTRSYSPMDGLVGKRFLYPGALVTANTPILDLVDLRTLRMVINVVERDIVRVRRGVAAEISVDAFPGRTFQGKVLRTSPVLDPATRTGEVEIHVANRQLDLRAEMFARVTLDLGSQLQGILVPREAMVYQGDQSGVFILEGDIARFRPVEAGRTQQDRVEIIEGLRSGERVVALGASLLKDGDRVRLRDERPKGKGS